MSCVLTGPDAHLQCVQCKVGPRSDFESCQPTTRRENTSMTNAAYTQPANVRQYVMSATHSWFGAVAVKSRSTRSGRVSGPLPWIVVRGPFARLTPRRPAERISRSMVQRATEIPFPAQLGVELLRAVDAEVLRVNTELDPPTALIVKFIDQRKHEFRRRAPTAAR